MAPDKVRLTKRQTACIKCNTTKRPPPLLLSPVYLYSVETLLVRAGNGKQLPSDCMLLAAAIQASLWGCMVGDFCTHIQTFTQRTSTRAPPTRSLAISRYGMAFISGLSDSSASSSFSRKDRWNVMKQGPLCPWQQLQQEFAQDNKTAGYHATLRGVSCASRCEGACHAPGNLNARG